MECNREKAQKFKAMAEDKFRENDYGGAKRYALEAYKTYPEMERITEMMKNLDFLISRAREIKNMDDCCAILGVDPSADEQQVKARYRDLILQFHPDKNRSTGADAATKLIDMAKQHLLDSSPAERTKQRNRRAPRDAEDEDLSRLFTTRNSGPQRAEWPLQPCEEYAFESLQQWEFYTWCEQCKAKYRWHKKFAGELVDCLQCGRPFSAKRRREASSSVWNSVRVTFRKR